MFVKLTERPELGDVVYLYPDQYHGNALSYCSIPMTVTLLTFAENVREREKLMKSGIVVSWFAEDGSMHQVVLNWDSLYKKLPPQVAQINKAD